MIPAKHAMNQFPFSFVGRARRNLIRLAGIALLLLTLPAGAQLGPPPAPANAAESANRFNPLFYPLPALSGTLSPDGKYIAYAIRKQKQTFVLTLEIDNPARAQTSVLVGNDSDATPGMTDDLEETPLNVRWMQWVTPSRLVIETNAVDMTHDGDWSASRGHILAVDANGRNAKTLLRSRDLSWDWDDPTPNFSRENWIGWTADQPISMYETQPFLSSHGSLWPNPSRSRTRSGNYANLSFFDFSPDDPDAILVHGGAKGNGARLYKLNVHTAGLKLLHDEVGAPGMHLLVNRQGQIRMGVYQTSRASAPMDYVFEKRPSGLLRWTKVDSLVGTPAGTAGFSISPENFFGERAFPVGFADDPDVLYYASNIGRDTFGLYEVNLRTGTRGPLALEDPRYDMVRPPLGGFPPPSNLVFDRYTRQLVGLNYESTRRTTRWLDPVLQEVQATLEESIRGREVQIKEWDQDRNRFLAVAQSWTDAGAIYVFDRAKRKLWEFVRRAPWLDAEKPHEVIEFAYDSAGGTRLSGQVIVPRFARMKQVPVVCFCPDNPWERTSSRYRGELRALADMGFIVVQVNPRGALGFGRKSRDAALTEGWDNAQSGDIVTALDELAKTYRINTQRVALLGEGLGGYLALRTAQRFPERFRCVVTLNPIVDIGAWLEQTRWTQRSATPELLRGFFGDARSLAKSPLLSNTAGITRPTFVLSYPGRRGEARTFTYLAARGFATALRRNNTKVEFLDLEPEFQRHLPAATSAVYRQIESFLNLNIYDYGVQLGPLEEQEMDPAIVTPPARTDAPPAAP